MAARGQIKPPLEPLNKVFDRVTDYLDKHGSAAVFLVGGRPVFTKCGSPAFDRRAETLNSGMVGVYDRSVDARWIREDLQEFYK